MQSLCKGALCLTVTLVPPLLALCTFVFIPEKNGYLSQLFLDERSDLIHDSIDSSSEALNSKPPIHGASSLMDRIGCIWFRGFFIRLRPNTLQLVGAQRTCPPALWRGSRLDGAAGSFIVSRRVFQMPEKHKNKTEEFIRYCPEDCKCYEPGVGVRCKAEDVGLQSFVRCLEKDPKKCSFSVAYAYSYYCKCPVRVYVAKNLKM